MLFEGIVVHTQKLHTQSLLLKKGKKKKRKDKKRKKQKVIHDGLDYLMGNGTSELCGTNIFVWV